MADDLEEHPSIQSDVGVAFDTVDADRGQAPRWDIARRG